MLPEAQWSIYPSGLFLPKMPARFPPIMLFTCSASTFYCLTLRSTILYFHGFFTVFAGIHISSERQWVRRKVRQFCNVLNSNYKQAWELPNYIFCLGVWRTKKKIFQHWYRPFHFLSFINFNILEDIHLDTNQQLSRSRQFLEKN